MARRNYQAKACTPCSRTNALSCRSTSAIPNRDCCFSRNTAMKLISLNVGLPRDVIWKGRTVTTGIFKEPLDGPVHLRKLNLDGDRQADLSVHGGPEKA